MDLLKELEAKKERLRLLRERRKQNNLDYGIETQSIEMDKASDKGIDAATVKMVNAATQTDESTPSLSEHGFKHSLPPMQAIKKKPEIITYDHGVQTDPVEFHDLQPENNNKIEVDSKLADEKDSEEIGPKSSNKRDSKLFDFPDLKPLVISTGYGASESNQVETFASRWYSRGENVNQQQSQKKDNDQGGVMHLHSCVLNDLDSHQNVTCQFIDYDNNRHVTMASFTVDDNTSQISISKSYTYVIDTFTDKIIDKIELLGQNVTRNLILRKFETHNIISMLLLTRRGKVLLYELQKSPQDKHIKWDRNVISKNYHLGCDYLTAFWESKFKIITGDSKGFISLMNSLDLSQDKTLLNGNTNIDSTKTQVIPPPTNMLYNTEEKDDMVQLFIDEYLSKLVIFNEVNITTLVGSPFNDECLFIGTEDGGIYKILLTDVDKSNKKITLDLENNGFLPLAQKHLEETETSEQQQINKTLFHNGYVTNISMEPKGLLLTSSVDWTIKLWDIKDNQYFDTLDLQKPVLSVDWITDGLNKNPFDDKYVCYAMTWDTIYIIQWFITESLDSYEDKKNKKYFHKEQPATILIKVGIDQLNVPMEQFTACKLIVEEEVAASQLNALLILTGDSSTIEYVQVTIQPR